MAWALQERDAKGADSSTKEGHLIPCRIGGFFDVADPISANEQSTWSHAGNNAGKTHNILPVAFSAKDHGADAGELSPTLRAGGHTTSHANGGVMPAVSLPMGVRRLTPLECLRLMSWPDTHFDGLGFADSTKYKMCGNGVVLNVAEWIGRRIVKALAP